jgi:hypothetical protein
MTIYIATICKLWDRSGRPDGDWACFIDKQKSNAIKKAIAARTTWESKGYGPYKILVGTLDSELATTYTLNPIDSPVTKYTNNMSKTWDSSGDEGNW